MKEVVVIGGSSIDIIGSPQYDFIARDSNPGQIEITAGGVGRNIAENLARLGVNCTLLTCIGKDVYGKIIIQKSMEAGINIKIFLN